MEELKEKELPETAESTKTDENRQISTISDENRLFSTKTDAPSGVEEEEETEKTDENRLFPTISDGRKFLLGLLVGALGAGIVAVIAIVLLFRLRPEPPVQTVTVTETVYITVEATEPTLPPPEANPLYPEDFTFDENGYMICTARPYVMGIDVSTYQKEVDWEQVKAAGVEFAMIRVAWRGYESGLLTEDTMAREHYQGATAAGIKVGVYVFSQAVSTQEAEEEAAFLLEITKDWNLEMPVVFDWEHTHEDGRTKDMTAEVLTDCTKAFCETVRIAGRTPMVYFSVNHARDRLQLGKLKDYPFWLAYYDTQLDFPYKVDMWQYTQTGAVPGITGDVDINLYFPWTAA